MTDQMLYSQRMAYLRMGMVRRAVHRVLWELRMALPLTPTTNYLWFMYRRTWPK